MLYHGASIMWFTQILYRKYKFLLGQMDTPEEQTPTITIIMKSLDHIIISVDFNTLQTPQ